MYLVTFNGWKYDENSTDIYCLGIYDSKEKAMSELIKAEKEHNIVGVISKLNKNETLNITEENIACSTSVYLGGYIKED